MWAAVWAEHYVYQHTKYCGSMVPESNKNYLLYINIFIKKCKRYKKIIIWDNNFQIILKF